MNLVVFDTVNMELLNGDSATPLNVQLLGTSQDYTFRLTNTGQDPLDLETVSLGSTNASEFTLAHSPISSASDIQQNESFNLTVTFSPSGPTSGTRNATINIVSNDSSNRLFSFNISGLGLSARGDEDRDGLSDWAEFSLSRLGYNWQVSQHNLVDDLFNNASTADLFLTPSEAAAVDDSTVLSEVDLTTNTALFTIELQESLDLQGFDHMTIDTDDLSVDGDGNIRLEVDAPAGKKFYRAGFKP